jgi:AAA15 family ATPase/GTPase
MTTAPRDNHNCPKKFITQYSRLNMLEKIELKRFKKFISSTVRLSPFTVLMGENSSGKTTVLQAINFSLECLFRYELIESEVVQGKYKIRKRGIGLSELPGISISEKSEICYAKKTGSGGGKSKSTSGGAEIHLFDDKNSKYTIHVQLLFGGINIKCKEDESSVLQASSLHKKHPLFISGFIGLRPTEERVFPATLQDRLSHGNVSSIIRNLLIDCHTNHKEQYEKLEKRLFSDFNFRLSSIDFDEKKDLYVTAQFEETCESIDLKLDLNASGSGLLQVLQILAPIYRYCPEFSEVVLLDEPDAHLHPNLQTQLARTLKDIQKELNIQIIISTHSTSIIRAASPTEVVPISSLVDFNEPLSKKEEVEEEISNRIDAYELGKSVISGKIVFVEDGNTSILEKFDQVLRSNCFVGNNTVPIIKGKGKDDKTPFNLTPLLEKFVPQRSIEVHVLRDGDSLNQNWRDKLRSYASKKNVVLHQLDKHEIENYILKPDLWLRAIKRKHGDDVSISSSEIEEKMKKALKETIELSKYKMRQCLSDNIYKAASLLGEQNYRGSNNCDGEADLICSTYENVTDFELLRKIGMGKESSKEVREWLNTKGVNISQADILNALEKEDIDDEIREILTKLRSNAAEPMDRVRQQLSLENCGQE